MAAIKRQLVMLCMYLYSAQYLHILQDSKRYLTNPTVQVQPQLQLCLNKVEKWADKNGFKFSKTKAVCIHFCNKRKLHPDSSLTKYNSQIPVVSQTKLIGVTPQLQNAAL